MSRRSSRLVSGGYYNSDEDSDSSNVTSISYRENPVKVFKKRGTPKARVPVKDSSVPSVAIEPPVTADQNVGENYMASCYYEGRPGLLRKPFQKELSQGGVDSSGYSSSEGTRRKPAATTSISNAPINGLSVRCSDIILRVMDSVSLTAAAVQERIMRLAALAAQMSPSSRTKKACGFILLLIIVILSLWFFLPFLTSYISHMAAVKTSAQTQHQNHPISSASHPLQPNTAKATSMVDPAIVSAAVKQEMKHLLSELQMKQESLLSQMQLDIQDVKTKLEAVDSNSHWGLKKKIALLDRQMADYQTERNTSDVRLNLRIQAVEAKNAELSQELLSIQQSPPAEPCPDTSTVPVPGHLTPELQQALERWLADRIKEQDVIRLGDQRRSSDCGRPVADKMADFALESQGASVVSTRCSETYHIRSACVTLFGFPLWYPSESPRTVIQGYPVLLPGRCWAFHGVQGTLVISLSHPIRISHVTLDHLPRYNSPTGRIDSAPKDFEVYGMVNDKEEGTLLGIFTYDKDGDPTQTFELAKPSEAVHRYVALRVLTNWGQVEYTCIYRFRVHGTMAST